MGTVARADGGVGERGTLPGRALRGMDQARKKGEFNEIGRAGVKHSHLPPFGRFGIHFFGTLIHFLLLGGGSTGMAIRVGAAGGAAAWCNGHRTRNLGDGEGIGSV